MKICENRGGWEGGKLFRIQFMLRWKAIVKSNEF